MRLQSYAKKTETSPENEKVFGSKQEAILIRNEKLGTRNRGWANPAINLLTSDLVN